MLEICRSLQLDVAEHDALCYLRSLPTSSVGVVTSFHMFEHLPFEAVAALLDQAVRVLKPGGLLILETPNPSNVLVGSNTFYLDPTHRNPLPTPMLRFFVEARGFCNSQVLQLHPYSPAIVPLPPDSDPVSTHIRDLFYGPQDYAVIAHRP
jgi:O-antigen chain-terminating methyltransferase